MNYDKLKNREIKQSFFPLNLDDVNEHIRESEEDGEPDEPIMTGRVLYGFNEINDGEVSFFLGPEEKQRFNGDNITISDQFHCGTGDVLEELFADFDEEGMYVMISAWENGHEISQIPDGKEYTVWEIIKERVEKAGAIETLEELST